MRRLILFCIRLYQKTVSPDHGPARYFFPHGYCRFYPTCSQYAHDAITRYGAWRGGLKALGRVARCNPWNRGGYDPVT